MKQQSLMLTYGLVFLITAIWGLNVVFLKVLVENLPPQTMTAFRIMIAGITAIIIVYFAKSLRALSVREWLYTAFGMIFGVILHHLTLALGLMTTAASTGSLILSLVPLATAVLAVIFLGEQLTKMRVLGFILALTGVFFIQGGSFSGLKLSQGELLLFTSMFAQAISFIFIKKATATLDSKAVTAIMNLAGSVGLLLIAFIAEPDGLSNMTSASLGVYIVLFTSGIVATGIGHMVFNSAIQKIGASKTAIFNNFVPFFGVLFSVIFLNEMIEPAQLIGFVFIVAGVLFGTGYIERVWMKRQSKKVR
ncbi:putative DMT superfamily transporter inner membrane protein [Jeotgalicoccus aerolatus]|uniref:Drug/metabolite transporter (DMT)-like permease n=1 Tax=Jeotgalicoccus aerolatus TaxID=709510 RepID=A0ABS4HQ09_9STAP|nr:DMT family transporter [Jeotgalicoccus aerolatus]MBP1953020.1 drug/metabolite transporter (DMT)-like permease [Jeotgalicoccus aerolatus]GGE01867.1 membrane protein [Jeotgalicoccus aerolatus]CAD2073105.1 putative DMT superfamily transporter inner membrane protein [Jeotgalicoccus aerolatus]HJG33740.1 DMT family transporter [Jeotgalicoccus aerolatus]